MDLWEPREGNLPGPPGDVLAAQGRLALTEELVRLSEQVLNTVSERVKAGKVSPLEEVKANVTLSATRIERERAERDLEIARRRLAATWDSKLPAFERAKGQLDLVAPLPSAKQIDGLISRNPEIARWVVEMEKRQAAVELEKARRIPDLTVSADVQRFNETDTQAFGLGVSIPLPLFDRNQGGVLEARYRVAQAREERRAAEVRVLTELTEAYQGLATAYAEVTALKNDLLPGAQRAFDAASEGYRQGKFGFLDVLDAQRTLFEVKGQYLEALSAYHKSVAEVERLIGEGLDAVRNNPQQEREERGDE